MEAVARAGGRDARNRLLVHPKSAQVVLEVLRRPGDVAGDITKTIMTDPALSASVLRAANSAHLGYSHRIGGIRQASVMLGASLVGSLAAGRVADLVFDAEAPDYPEWLWLHSITMGCACSVLARHVGEPADDAFTVGLLHDVGWLLAASTGRQWQGADSEHAVAGAELLARWNLPDRIVAAVRHHHARSSALRAPLDRMGAAAHAFAAALGAPSPARSMSIGEAMVLLGISDVRERVLLAQIESELVSLTSGLTSQP
ncbi:MAG: HDOD domain-containing protein [Actinomycetota bacterium]|jgi:putative nucleotidyltransferase with HDIG domain